MTSTSFRFSSFFDSSSFFSSKKIIEGQRPDIERSSRQWNPRVSVLYESTCTQCMVSFSSNFSEISTISRPSTHFVPKNWVMRFYRMKSNGSKASSSRVIDDIRSLHRRNCRRFLRGFSPRYQQLARWWNIDTSNIFNWIVTFVVKF